MTITHEFIWSAGDAAAFPFYELRFIMRVLSHKGRAPEADWQTAHGMAKAIFEAGHATALTAASPGGQQPVAVNLPWPWAKPAEVLEDAIAHIEGQQRLKDAIRLLIDVLAAASPAGQQLVAVPAEAKCDDDATIQEKHYVTGWNACRHQMLAAAPDVAAIGEGVPQPDAIAHALMDAVERGQFECQAGPLASCVAWQALRDHANGEQVADALVDPAGFRARADAQAAKGGAQ